MTEQIHQIESELRGLEKELYAASAEYVTLARDAAERRAQYDVDYASAMLQISARADADGLKMTVIEKESLCVKSVAPQLKACRVAEAMADGSKRHLGTLQSLLSSVQTRSKLIVTERSLVNYAS